MIDKKDLIRLRKITHLGIAKCNKALVATKGNIEEAIKLLRKEGAKIAAKRVNRSMDAGRVFVKLSEDSTKGVMLGLGCETDFVAKNESMQAFGEKLATISLESSAKSKEELLEQTYEGNATCGDELVQLAGRVGENVALVSYRYFEAPLIGFYIHTGSKLGAVATLNTATHDQEDLPKLARDIAMQVVVRDPIAINEAKINPTLLANEKDLILTQLEKLPESQKANLDKFVERGIAKFVKENTLIAQEFIHNENVSVEKHLKSISPSLEVLEIARMQMGI
jgi:elongation factor Ts